MRNGFLVLCVLGALMIGANNVAAAGELGACSICTCANGEVACEGTPLEVLEEQGPCATLCAGIGSSGVSGPMLVEAPCSEVPQCGGAVGAPAAGPLWLAAGAFGLLGLGAMGVRRARRRNG